MQLKRKHASMLALAAMLSAAAAGAAYGADDLDARIAALPPGPDTDAIVLGRNITFDTPHYAPGHVSGNAISCASCHIGGGMQAKASPWGGITGVMPSYSGRSATVESLSQRINNCFVRSENGTPLAFDSPEMNGLLAYMAFLSRGVTGGDFVPGRGMGKIANIAKMTPDRAHGQAIYTQRCASCHGANGEGMRSGGTFSIPPLWGEASYNIGASMARLSPAAAFIKNNMPLGQGGTLTDQEAVDVAAYVTQQPRPDYPPKVNDWPKGGKPADARY
ncbi:cytochrome C [Trinickia dabaoshanensis]|uniref:Cytochrome C n=1 Tax=Trinickia dabaoshanensis TaxID=564714 RepID=A0A2N7VBH0_9BURK|nr:c-type cytochrome [Trinickia dabaoshanensis]PMS14511.1 cytochrome C [Trinickia dabaoshanensis]